MPAAPTALPGWVPPHLQQNYRASLDQLPPAPIEHDREYDFEGDDDFSLNSDGVDDFFNSSLLSHIAVKLRDKVPRETHVKGGIPYHNAFTGRDVVVCAPLFRCSSGDQYKLNRHTLACSASSQPYNPLSSVISLISPLTVGARR